MGARRTVARGRRGSLGAVMQAADGMASTLRLCHIAELADRESRGFDPHGIGHVTMFVVRVGSALHAYRDACPHYGDTPMAWRNDGYLNARRNRIVCHAHGAQFDIATGECLLGPCLGQSLRPIELSVNGSGDVHIRLEVKGENLS